MPVNHGAAGTVKCSVNLPGVELDHSISDVPASALQLAQQRSLYSTRRDSGEVPGTKALTATTVPGGPDGGVRVIQLPGGLMVPTIAVLENERAVIW